MNINDCLTAPPRRTGRNSDPDPNWWKEEQLDGRLIWPKLIDPDTGRPAQRPFRNGTMRAYNDADTETGPI